jgi:hypothetical protein
MPGRILRTEADFLAAIAAAPDQDSADVLRGHLVTLRQQLRERQVLAREGYDAFAGVTLADPAWDEVL